jgi:hypothetical protein
MQLVLTDFLKTQPEIKLQIRHWLTAQACDDDNDDTNNTDERE